MGRPPTTYVGSYEQVAQQVETTGYTYTDSLLAQLLALLRGAFEAGGSQGKIEVITYGSTGAQRLGAQATAVKAAIIQNLSTDPIPVHTDSSVAPGVGTILNPATAANQAGGALPTGNVDLSRFWVYVPTSGDRLAIYEVV
jgi:hypothetical protein